MTGSYLASGAAIGVTVLNTSGGNYDGTSYSNIKFTSSGTDASQTWSGASTVKLSATEGYCYAYYPYNSSASSITAIPVTAGGTDYMYATKASVNDKSKTASLTMKHALSAIRFALKKGTYGGTGKVTAVSVTSSALGSSGTLNATTGVVTAANKGTTVSQNASLTLSTTVQNVDVVMVPSGNAGSITLSLTIDGKVYSTEVSSTTIKQGSCYTCTLTVDAGSLALSGVKIGDWGYDDIGAPVITAGGYTVTFAGDYSDISFSNSVSGNTVMIQACSMGEEKPKKVTMSGTALLSQSANHIQRTRTITVSNIESDVTVFFNGIGSNWDTVTADGVYYVGEDGDYTATASSSCIGVALINNATNQRLMIEKYENANNAESTTVYITAAQKLGHSLTNGFTWGRDGYNSDIFDSDRVGDGSSEIYGYLPNRYGDYAGSPELSGDPSTWIGKRGALSDFNGKGNTAIIKNLILNGNHSSYESAPMAHLVNEFNNVNCPQSVNQGFYDWFIPSLGQLGLISLRIENVNKALTAIGGTAFQSSSYWSSSERESVAWSMKLNARFIDNVSVGYKYSIKLVRLVRDL